MKKLLVLLFLCVLPALAAAEGVGSAPTGNFPVYMQVCSSYATESLSCEPLTSIGTNMPATDLEQQIVNLGCSGNGNGMYFCPPSSSGAQLYATNANVYVVAVNYGPPGQLILSPTNMVLRLNVLIAY
ncbi:MAG: hypothetical protein WC091_07705 [Sulfuricellaceae bacterium]